MDEIIVPETWFFRYAASFAFLQEHVRSEWLARHDNKILQVLSLPCATGEEPYSIAISLIHAQFPCTRFQIDAVDISEKVLNKAETGAYVTESFREKGPLPDLDLYFDENNQGRQVRSAVKNTIRFIQGNVPDAQCPIRQKTYDVIFCRNLLIYLTPSARKQTLNVLGEILTRDGILFMGHTEFFVYPGSRI